MRIDRRRAKKGAKGQPPGCSRGGLITKTHMLIDALCRLLPFIVTAGRVDDVTQAPSLLERQMDRSALADKDYAGGALQATRKAIEAAAAAPSNRTASLSSRTIRRPQASQAYRTMHPAPQTFLPFRDDLDPANVDQSQSAASRDFRGSSLSLLAWAIRRQPVAVRCRPPGKTGSRSDARQAGASEGNHADEVPSVVPSATKVSKQETARVPNP